MKIEIADAKSRQSNSVDNFADFHVHINDKSFVTGRKNIYTRYSKARPKYSKIAGRSGYNEYVQSDPYALYHGNVKIAHATMYCLENYHQKAWVSKYLASLFSGFKLRWQRKYFKSNATYWQCFKNNIIHYHGAMLPPTNAKLPSNDIDYWNKFRIVKSLKEFVCENEEFKLVTNVEGLHSFFDTYQKDNITFHDLMRRISYFKRVDLKSYLNRLRGNKRFSEEELTIDEEAYIVPLFSIGLCHFEYNFILGESAGIPAPKFLLYFFGPRRVSPNFGLNQKGEKIIKYLYFKDRINRRILIDIKHMSIKARLQFYKYKEKLDVNDEIPIIMTHGAVSGYEFMDDAMNGPDTYWCWRNGPRDKFNPMHLNICDEELTKIYESKGLFGITVEQRILGDMRLLFGQYFKTRYYRQTKKWIKSLKTKKKKDQNENSDYWLKYNNQLLVHATMFLDNLFHIIEVMNKEYNGFDPWKCVCIGSDFDGLVDPIECCPTAEDLPKFKELLFRLLNYKPFRDRYWNLVPNGELLNDKLELLFYENIRRFTQEQISKNWPSS